MLTGETRSKESRDGGQVGPAAVKSLNVNLTDGTSVSGAGNIVPLVIFSALIPDATRVRVAPIRFPRGPVGEGEGEAGIGRARLPDKRTAARCSAGALCARVESKVASPDRTWGCHCVKTTPQQAATKHTDQ